MVTNVLGRILRGIISLVAIYWATINFVIISPQIICYYRTLPHNFPNDPHSMFIVLLRIRIKNRPPFSIIHDMNESCSMSTDVYNDFFHPSEARNSSLTLKARCQTPPDSFVTEFCIKTAPCCSDIVFPFSPRQRRPWCRGRLSETGPGGN